MTMTKVRQEGGEAGRRHHENPPPVRRAETLDQSGQEHEVDRQRDQVEQDQHEAADLVGMRAQADAAEAVNRPVDGGHQRGQNRRLARIEVAVVLDHVDGVPVGLLDDLVDGVREALDAHVRFDQRPEGTPAAAVVGAQERAAQFGLLEPAGLELGQLFLQGRAGKPLRFQTAALGVEFDGKPLDAIVFERDFIDRIDRHDASEHRAQADEDQQHVDAPAEGGGGISAGAGRRVFRCGAGVSPARVRCRRDACTTRFGGIVHGWRVGVRSEME